MKYGHKIFIITFILITFSINVIGMIIISNNHKNNIDSQINKGIFEMNTILSGLKIYNIDNLQQCIPKDVNIEISDSENIIYTNMLYDLSEVKNNIKPEEHKIRYYIKDNILYMSSKQDNNEVIITINVSEIYELRSSQIHFFIKVSMVASITIALFLYIIIMFLTRRIKKLNKAVGTITDGDYSIRIKSLGKDELGNLGNAFNQMAESIDKNISEIKRISENRKDFINNITHEIRTPLTSIVGFSSLIKNKKINNEQTIIEYSRKIYDEGMYLKLLSDKLMDMVLLDNNSIQLEYINVSNEIVKICNSLDIIFEEVFLKLDIDKDIYFKSDAILLKSLITNLAKNAINAYNEKDKKIVEINFQKSHESIVLKIIDYGKGIPQEEIEKILEPFYTVSKDRNRKKSGMGLGLPLCMKLTHYLNAMLKIDSVEGEKTQISIIWKRKEETQ